MADGSNRPSYGPHPDAVLLKRRRMERARTAVKLALAMVAPLDREPRQRQRKAPVNCKARTCPNCNRTLGPIRQWFGLNGQKKFRVECRPAAQQLKRVNVVRPKVPRICPGCLTEYPMHRGNFGPSGSWVVCKACRELVGRPVVTLAKVRKIREAERRARNAEAG